MKFDYLCSDNPVTGFERVLRITNEYGFWWFLQVTGDFEASKIRASEVIADIVANTKSKHSFNHYLMPI